PPTIRKPHIRRRSTTLIMKQKILISFCIMAVLFLLAAGCTQPAAPPATPTPTAPPGTPVPTTSATVAPVITPDYIEGPIPSQYSVDVQVDRNTVSIDPKITITYRGGKGINFVSTLQVKVTTSDGRVITPDALYKPQVNDEVVVQGSTGTDRVEVFVTIVNGDRYKIYDQEHAFRTYS
ncbi:MAG TPA: hypothetical protein VMW63_07840, partial [Methanoregulaceae archaeon]|nr:hypothetical protein [Methanoregulaceae archaeon]